MVVRMDDAHSEALNNWGAALTLLAESRGGEEAGRLLEIAAGKLGAPPYVLRGAITVSHACIPLCCPVAS